jgi:16S rRNA (cytosine1402-N4)-methyltransferase
MRVRPAVRRVRGLNRTNHRPVMLEQVTDLLRPRPGGRYVDLTLGTGGHARRILEASSPDVLVLGLDRDSDVIRRAKENLKSFGERLRAFHGRFSQLPRALDQAGWKTVDGMLADLGVSSLQLESPERGFSFQQRGPLDMRMDPTQGQPLSAILSILDVDALADVLRRFGEVKSPRAIARRILSAQREGKLTDTLALARVAAEKKPTSARHPATRVFMALRMMVNQEIEELQTLLARLPDPLQPRGRVVVISFHSLEDRLVKNRMKVLEGRCTCPPGLPECRCGCRQVLRMLTRRVVRPAAQEVSENPRARSARLRAAERVAA